MNAVSGPMIGPSYGMGPMGGTGLGGLSMDSMGGQFAPGDMMLGVTGLADPMGGILGPSPFGPVGEYGNSTVEPVVEFFEDPSLYNNYGRNNLPTSRPEENSNSGSESQTHTGTTSNDTIDKTDSDRAWVLDGLNGNDTLKRR